MLFNNTKIINRQCSTTIGRCSLGTENNFIHTYMSINSSYILIYRSCRLRVHAVRCWDSSWNDCNVAVFNTTNNLKLCSNFPLHVSYNLLSSIALMQLLWRFLHMQIEDVLLLGIAVICSNTNKQGQIVTKVLVIFFNKKLLAYFFQYKFVSDRDTIKRVGYISTIMGANQQANILLPILNEIV